MMAATPMMISVTDFGSEFVATSANGIAVRIRASAKPAR